jgi:hypothetical protein
MPSRQLSRFAVAVRALAEHTVAGAVVVAVSVAGAAGAYISLLLWAIATGSGLGGPLALPGIVLVVYLAAVIAVLFILFPVMTATQFVCRRIRHRWIAEIVVSSLLLIVFVVALSIGFAFSRSMSASGAAKLAAVASSILLILLGVYWWSLQMSGLLLRFVTDVAARVHFVWRARRDAA